MASGTTAPCRIGIDLGGTKVEAAVVDVEGTIVDRSRLPTPRDDYAATLETIGQLVSELEGRAGRTMSVGVGMPGTLAPSTGLVMNANSVWLNGRPLGVDLQRRLNRPLRFQNDANCFALSEARDGAGQGHRVVFGVILGTGVGGGLIVEGRIWTGRNAVGGEWGHNPLPWPGDAERPGPDCYCGRAGCIETFLSGPGLRADHQRATGLGWEPDRITAAAARGDEAAAATLYRYDHRLARSLAGLVNVLDPDVIVLGGGLSAMGHLYQTIPALWTPYVFTDHVTTPILPPTHGASSGVRGAAWLWDGE